MEVRATNDHSVNSRTADTVTSMQFSALYPSKQPYITHTSKDISMYKNIALIALLLPFSGYAITKKERMDDLQDTARVLTWNAMSDWMYILCTHQCVDLSMIPVEKRAWFLKKMEDFKNKMDEIEKEYKELEQA